ncbi:M48 family metallopeptidase [Aquimarina sp. ERC-38]|uniref:M48 family metallopeptidase n=1 Tax=Aquimarina sp. ERC-38 TaxID=2949996 RepID=UPI0022460FF1|nr:M48 family metallopeptidase [Aquimarina sp. ERC-38]UZO80454.1 M48 family metallopeptidase [Aquimarina sp. ERC-38]
MTPQVLFYIIISILSIEFIIETCIDVLNARHYKKKIPVELQDVYPTEEYQKSLSYKKVNYKFKIVTSATSLLIVLLFFFMDGFAYLDRWVRMISSNEIIVSLLFFGSIVIVSDILSIPSSYYRTFVIEEKFGFNKTSPKTFWVDKLKGLIMMVLIGGPILAAITWFYLQTKEDFWIYAWLLMSGFAILMNMFYAKLIVPLFNKQTPLEQGSLRNIIEAYSEKVNFGLKDIYVIDGSKRSTKANAYFSGLGSEKRITLYDTLINDLDEEEIVAVLAHEVGHFKRKHIVINLLISMLVTALTLYLFSLCINNSLLSQSLNIAEPSFHIGLVVFGILYSPISEISGILMNYISRKFEFQADSYAKETYSGEALITSLKKLSRNNLNNLTPHPAMVFVHYSHPTLLQRIKNIREMA